MKKKSEEGEWNVFKKVRWNPEKNDFFIIISLCAVIFCAAFFMGAEAMGRQQENASFSFFDGDVLAAEDTNFGPERKADQNILYVENGTANTISGAKNSVKAKYEQAIQAKKIARQKAADAALARSGPEPTGPTTAGPGGRRICAVKNDKPQSGGSPHVDEDCCPDYDEYPNPRCFYNNPGILKRK